MTHASYNNQARIHNGYHYPRSVFTALRSRVSFPRFVKDFPNCVHSSFDKYYCIGRHLSKVSSNQFYKFCKRIGAEIEPAPYKFSKYNSKVKVIEGSIKVKIQNSNDVLIYCYSPSFIDQIHYSKIDKNYNSIVTYIIEENCLYIFTGDAIVNKQKEYITDLFNNKSLKLPQNSNKIDKVVLKVSHHGSYTGTDDVLIKAIENYVNIINGDDEQNDNRKYLEISFISCGNQYGLPDKITVNCLINSTFDNHASDCKNSHNRNNDLKKIAKQSNTTPKLLKITPDSYKI